MTRSLSRFAPHLQQRPCWHPPSQVPSPTPSLSLNWVKAFARMRWLRPLVPAHSTFLLVCSPARASSTTLVTWGIMFITWVVFLNERKRKIGRMEGARKTWTEWKEQRNSQKRGIMWMGKIGSYCSSLESNESSLLSIKNSISYMDESRIPTFPYGLVLEFANSLPHPHQILEASLALFPSFRPQKATDWVERY